jgi:hypothetical protein
VVEIAFQVPQLHRLHGRDTAAGLQKLAQLANVDLVVALGLRSEATANQPILQELLLRLLASVTPQCAVQVVLSNLS